MFELGNYKSIISNFSLRGSCQIDEFLAQNNSIENQSDFSNVSILLGVGLRTRGFKYFSLNTGIAWSQIQMLNPNLRLNTDCDTETLVQSEIGTDYLENQWRDGPFIGVGFNF
jgi:hypothetical protein